MPGRPSIEHLLRGAALVAAVFGIATVASGGRVLFGDGAQAAGNYVPFVVWFNFLAGFAYIGAAAGLWRARRWGAVLAAALAVAAALVLAALGGHIAAGGAFELRTVAAMVLRTALWGALAVLGCYAAARLPGARTARCC